MGRDRSAPSIVDVAGTPRLNGVFPQERIVSPVVDSVRVYLMNSIDSLARSGCDLGRAPRSMRMIGVTLLLNRSSQQEAAFAALLTELKKQLPSPFPGQFSAQVFAALFGLAKTDIGQVVSWMTSQKLESIKVSPWCTSITFSGGVRIVEAAFRTRIHWYRMDRNEYLANISELSVPAALAEVISSFGISARLR